MTPEERARAWRLSLNTHHALRSSAIAVDEMERKVAAAIAEAVAEERERAARLAETVEQTGDILREDIAAAIRGGKAE